MIAERTALRVTRWRAIGTDVELVTSGAGPSRHDTAVAWMKTELDAIDLACSRFRADSELSEVNRRAGHWVSVSPRFVALLAESLRIAALTDGLVVPTLGRPLRVLGYDRDLSLVRVHGSGREAARADRAAARAAVDQHWHDVELDPAGGRVRIPDRLALDLGSIGKAAGADRIAAGLGAGVLTEIDACVNLGGDIAVHEGARIRSGSGRAVLVDPISWEIAIDESGHRDQRRSRTSVRIDRGGLATSSTVVRTWSQRGVRRHHILDPRTGLPADGHWRCVSAHGATASEANAATTAAVVLGASAPGWLTRRGLRARLVARDDSVTRTAGWPTDRAPDADPDLPPALTRSRMVA